MKFEPSDEQRMLGDTIQRFLAAEYDFARRTQRIAGTQDHSPALWTRFAELGVVGALFREEDGGLGGSGFDIALVFEALGRALVLEPFQAALVSATALGAAGTHRGLLEAIVTGRSIVAFAHEEPTSRYSHSRVTTRAHRAGESWVIDGAKAGVRHAEQADFLLVSARTSGADDDTQGLSLFVLPARGPGLALQGYPMMDDGRGADITLDRVRIGPDALVGTQGEAFAAIEHAVGSGVLAVCARTLGQMEVAHAATLDHLRTRQQFGVAIGSHQALQHRMVDLWLDLVQCRSALLNAARSWQGGRVERERALSAAKATFGRAAVRMAEECIQMHGGIGMTWELPLSHFARALVMADHTLGDEDYHLARYVALGRAGQVTA